jgi:hypothetical protein
MSNYVARWDGKSWQPLADGMDGYVRAMASYAGELVAAGHSSLMARRMILRVGMAQGGSRSQMPTIL